MRLTKNCLLVLLVAILPACERPMVKPVQQYQPKTALYQLKQWTMNGRVAVHAPQDSFSADLSWQHRQGEEILELSGPFGQGRTIIKVLPDRVIVDEGDRSHTYFQSAETVFNRYFAVRFPVRAVTYWLIGLADPGEKFSLLNNGFIQNGWRVEYSQEQLVGDVFLPRKIRLINQQTKIKIIIDQWKLS